MRPSRPPLATRCSAHSARRPDPGSARWPGPVSTRPGPIPRRPRVRAWGRPVPRWARPTPPRARGWSGQQTVQHDQRLVQDLRPDTRVSRLAERGEFAVRGAEANADDASPAGELVQGDDLLGHLPRSASGQRRAHRAEPEPAGGRPDRSEQHPGVVHRDAMDVVPEEEAVPAGLFGRDGAGDQLGWRPGGRAGDRVPHAPCLPGVVDSVRPDRSRGSAADRRACCPAG